MLFSNEKPVFCPTPDVLSHSRPLQGFFLYMTTPPSYYLAFTRRYGFYTQPFSIRKAINTRRTASPGKTALMLEQMIPSAFRCSLSFIVAFSFNSRFGC